MLSVFWAEDDPVTAGDRGLAYGDGLFETIRIHRQRPLLLERHLKRLLTGAEKLGITVTPEDIKQHLDSALKRHARNDEWVLKLVLTRGVGGRGYVPPVTSRPHLILSFHEMPSLPDPAGVSTQLARHTLVVSPDLAGLKSLNRLDQVMASRELSPGNYEVILTDSRGRLLEGSRTNLLMRFRGEWWVPPMGDIAVHGVMLEAVREQLRQAGEAVCERPLSMSLLRHPDCQGLYLLNSVIGFVPVNRIGCLHLPIDHTLATICDPLTSMK